MALQGLRKAARQKLTYLLYEKRLGVRTAGRIELHELGLDGEHRWRYEPAEWRTLNRVLDGGDVDGDDVFLDYGSGMGRMVLRAAQFGPRRVIGVELAPELSDVARENVERSRGRLKCKDIELVTADALTYEVPDDVTIVFFNNPFTGHIFAQVMEKIVASLERRPRRLRIVYRNPLEHEAVLATDRFRVAKRWRRRSRLRGKESGVTINLYESTPAAAPAAAEAAGDPATP